MQKKINKEAKQEAHPGMDDVRFSGEAGPREDLKIEWSSFVRFFNDTLRRNKSPIARIEFLSKGKKSRLQALVNAYGSKKALITAIEKMARSDFLNGRVKGNGWNRPFIASFIWLTESDEHFERVLSGYYDNPPEAELTPEEQRQLELERYKAREAERRAEVRRIDEDESARMAKERDQRQEMAATPDEIKRIIGDSWMLD